MPAEYEYPPRTYKHRKEQVAQVLWTLALDGPIEDRSGRCVAKLRDALAKRGVVFGENLKNLLPEFEEGGLYALNGIPYIERTVAGKHTKRLALAVDPDEVPFPANPFAADESFNYDEEFDDEEQLDDDETLQSGKSDPLQRLLEYAEQERHSNGAAPTAASDSEKSSPAQLPLTPEPQLERVAMIATPEPVHQDDLPTEDDASAADLVLLAISLLNQANIKLLTERTNYEIAAAHRLLRENEELRSTIEELRSDRRRLQHANAELERVVHSMQAKLRSSVR